MASVRIDLVKPMELGEFKKLHAKHFKHMTEDKRDKRLTEAHAFAMKKFEKKEETKVAKTVKAAEEEKKP